MADFNYCEQCRKLLGEICIITPTHARICMECYDNWGTWGILFDGCEIQWRFIHRGLNEEWITIKEAK